VVGIGVEKGGRAVEVENRCGGRQRRRRKRWWWWWWRNIERERVKFLWTIKK
jgi:hypothetical protein